MIQALLIQADLLSQFLRFAGSTGLEPVQNIDGALDVPTGHVVGKGIIVDVLMPFIGADHIVDLVISSLYIIFDAAGPECSRAQHYLCTIVTHEFVIARDTPVLPIGICDTC